MAAQAQRDYTYAAAYAQLTRLQTVHGWAADRSVNSLWPLAAGCLTYIYGEKRTLCFQAGAQWRDSGAHRHYPSLLQRRY